MKLIIDIDEDYYEMLKNNVEHGADYKPWVLIAKGTPITNGEFLLTLMQSVMTPEQLNEVLQKMTETPQGEWVKVKEERMSVDMSGEIVTRYKCSKCGRVIATFPSKLAEYYPFCHCGADMRGKEE